MQAQQKLSLSDALQAALANNYSILIENKSVEVAARNNSWGEAGAYPTVSISVSQSNARTNIDNPTSFLSGDIINTGINPTASVNWTIFNGFAVRINKERLARIQEETEGNASIVVQNTMQSVIQGYYTATLEKERLGVFQKVLKLSRDRYDYIKIKKDLGSSVTADLLLAEGNYLTDSTNFINQQMNYRSAVRTLNTLLNIDNLEQDYELADSLAFDDKPYEYATLAAGMEESNANLQRQYLTQAVLQSNTANSRTNLYPQIDLRLSYSNNINAQDLSKASLANSNAEAPTVPITAQTVNYGATFSLTYNLFNGGRIRRAIKNSILQEEIGLLRIDNLKQTLQRDLLAMLDMYNVRRQLKGIASRTKEVAETNMSISEERFKNGTITSLDYRQIQNNYLQAALGELQAIYNLIDANTQLMRLTGGIVKEQD